MVHRYSSVVVNLLFQFLEFHYILQMQLFVNLGRELVSYGSLRWFLIIPCPFLWFNPMRFIGIFGLSSRKHKTTLSFSLFFKLYTIKNLAFFNIDWVLSNMFTTSRLQVGSPWLINWVWSFLLFIFFLLLFFEKGLLEHV